MSKKVVKKKKLSKKVELPKADTTPKAEACSGCEILIGIGAVAAIIAIIMYFTNSGMFAESKIQVGDCYIDRSYKPVVVDSVYNSLGEVALREAEVYEGRIYPGWYLTGKAGTLRWRDISFVKEHYTKVNCANRD